MKDRRPIAVIDYGAGNILNVVRAFSSQGYEAVLVDDPKSFQGYSRFVLPGVGAFRFGMQNLNERGLSGAILDLIQQETPILGICLGMQLFAQRSFEGGETEGLGVLSGQVVHLASAAEFASGVLPIRKVPNTGWAGLSWSERAPIFDGLPVLSLRAAYFNHSYVLAGGNPKEWVATSEVGGVQFPAVVSKGSLFATQFHPEKSGEEGLAMLDWWASRDW